MSILVIPTDHSSLFLASTQCPEEKQSENQVLEGVHEAERLWSHLGDVKQKFQWIEGNGRVNHRYQYTYAIRMTKGIVVQEQNLRLRPQ